MGIEESSFSAGRDNIIQFLVGDVSKGVEADAEIGRLQYFFRRLEEQGGLRSSDEAYRAFRSGIRKSLLSGFVGSLFSFVFLLALGLFLAFGLGSLLWDFEASYGGGNDWPLFFLLVSGGCVIMGISLKVSLDHFHVGFLMFKMFNEENGLSSDNMLAGAGLVLGNFQYGTLTFFHLLIASEEGIRAEYCVGEVGRFSAGDVLKVEAFLHPKRAFAFILTAKKALESDFRGYNFLKEGGEIDVT